MNANIKLSTKRNLIIFIIVVLGFSTLAGIIDPLTVPPNAEPGATGFGQLLWLIAPLGVMILLRTFGGDSWEDFGIFPKFKGNRFWWFTSILIFPIAFAITLAIGSVFGSVKLVGNLLPDFLTAMVAGLATALIKNIFEEFAWRGYLAPKVYSLNLNIWLSHAIVGLVWGAWHLPFIFALWPYLTSNMLWYFIPLLFIGTFSQSVVYGEIRLATGSVLPAWIMHTIGNGIGNALIVSNYLRVTAGKELWFTPGAENVIIIVLMFIVGYWLHKQRTNL